MKKVNTIKTIGYSFDFAVKSAILCDKAIGIFANGRKIVIPTILNNKCEKATAAAAEF